MNQSDTLSELAKALAAVQGQLRPAEENARNPFFKSNYADLASIIAAARDLLDINGLSVSQFPGPTYNGESHHYATLTTILMHESGEWISQDLTMPLAKVDPQGYGSAITYARRYALASVLGIVAGEDDDGNAATGQATTTSVAQHDDKVRSTPTTRAEPKIMSAAKFVTYTTKKLGFKHDEHTRATMGLLGFKAVPNDPDKRKHMYNGLEVYREMRGRGLTKDDAMASMPSYKKDGE